MKTSHTDAPLPDTSLDPSVEPLLKTSAPTKRKRLQDNSSAAGQDDPKPKKLRADAAKSKGAVEKPVTKKTVGGSAKKVMKDGDDPMPVRF